MINGLGDEGAIADAAGQPLSSGVLADRIAATLVHHEPGWRLPRLTALARRYHVSTAEVDAAIDDLAARHLLRRLPDGQVYRASPAEYLLPLEGLAGLTSHVDPMGGKLACTRRQVLRRRPPEDIARALGLAPGEPVLATRCQWTVGAEPGALSASYLPERLAGAYCEDVAAPPFPCSAPAAATGQAPDQGTGPGEPRPGGLGQGPGILARPQALQVELTLPQPSVARSLRLSAGDLVAVVTVGFEDPAAGSPVALTVAMLRPDLFRIVIEATPGAVSRGGADGSASAWTYVRPGWEP